MRKDIVTSFRVDEELWKRARIYAIENGLTMKGLIETLLKIELEENRIKQKLKSEVKVYGAKSKR
jgi:antitoxin component of RelBE/YafQ-DinJ toxin-antitoxin module